MKKYLISIQLVVKANSMDAAEKNLKKQLKGFAEDIFIEYTMPNE